MDAEALFYGDGLFETVCVKDGHPIAVSRHLNRFQESAQFLGFPSSRIDEGSRALQSLSHCKNGLWRVTVARDAEGFGVAKGGVMATHRTPTPLASPRLTFCHGMFVPDDPLAVHKTTSYARNMYTRRFAISSGFDDALMVSRDGRVGEASTSNVFFVFEDHIATAPLQGVLPGTRRAAILECMDIHIRDIYVAECSTVTGIVLTSAAGIRAASSIDGRHLSPDIIDLFRCVEGRL